MQGSASSGADPCVPKFIDLVFESTTESKEILACAFKTSYAVCANLGIVKSIVNKLYF